MGPKKHIFFPSSPFGCSLCISFFLTSMKLFCGFSLFLRPGNSIFTILHPKCPLSLLCTCPNYLSLASWTLSPCCSTWSSRKLKTSPWTVIFTALPLGLSSTYQRWQNHFLKCLFTFREKNVCTTQLSWNNFTFKSLNILGCAQSHLKPWTEQQR